MIRGALFLLEDIAHLFSSSSVQEFTQPRGVRVQSVREFVVDLTFPWMQTCTSGEAFISSVHISFCK